MVDRLSAVDVSFLYLEGPATPMHLGNLAIFGPPVGELSYERLVALVEERIALVPRFRQRVLSVPGRLANPVWVDDADFDVAYHVRRSGLPKPGTDDQLREFVARIQSRPLDRRRPLWEMYLIEGLSGGRVALATKTHYSIVDGINSIDVEQVILDPQPRSRSGPEPIWMPRPAPGQAELVLDAIGDLARRPSRIVDVVGLAVRDARATAGRTFAAASGALSALSVLPLAVQSATSRPKPSPLHVRTGERRRFASVRAELADFRSIRADQDVDVNDVVLAVVAGALRGWLQLRGEAIHHTSTVRAMVPLSVDDPNQIVPTFVDLPVGEPNPLVRLSQIAFATRANAQPGRAVGAKALAAVGGFAPPTLHALAARVAGGLSNRLFQIAITNAPGPQHPLYASGARLREIYPIVPVAAGQALAIGVTSYDGGMYFGINADYDALPDLSQLVDGIEQSIAELLAANAQSGAAASRRARLAPVTAKRVTSSGSAVDGRKRRTAAK